MTVTEEHPSANTLKEVGSELSEARAARGRSVADASTSLRLVPAYIEAIERGDMSALPSAPYVVGYVRSYANYLGIDADPLCKRLRAGLGEGYFHPEYTFVQDKNPRSGGAGRMAFAATVMAMLVYGGWYAFDAGLVNSPDQSTSDEVVVTVLPGITDSAVTELPGLEEVDSAAGQDDALETAGTALGDSAAPAAEVGSAGTLAAIDAASQDAPDQQPAFESTPQVGQAVAHNRDPDTEMVIKALATSWVEISRPDGSIVNSWLMREGDEYLIPGDQDIYLTAGNAGGLEIEIAGRPPKKLGEWGETVNELPLDPALLSDRY